MATLTDLRRSLYFDWKASFIHFRNLDPQIVIASDQPLKLQTDLNGSTTITHTNKSLDEGMEELEIAGNRFSVVNTHELVQMYERH